MRYLLPVLLWVLATWGGLALLVLAILALAIIRDRRAALEARERRATALPPGPAGWGWLSRGERARFDAIVAEETAAERAREWDRIMRATGDQDDAGGGGS